MQELAHHVQLCTPHPVYNLDRSPNKAGAISRIVDLVLRYNGHTEHTQFAVTSLGKQNLILGYTWLCEHNPEVDWQINKIKMSCCSTKRCTCTNEEKVEQHEKHTEACHIQVCHAGPIPSTDNDLHDIPQSVQDSNEEDALTDADDCAIEEGDRIFVVQFGGKVEDICASQNVFTCLAEAFHKNSKPKSFQEPHQTTCMTLKTSS